MEGLIEKLCHRFRASEEERQWRDLAFCMSLLPYSHKSVQRLLENFACFSTKLVEPFVKDCFKTIINSSRKQAKQETKALIDELEQKIEETENKGVNESSPAQERLNTGEKSKKRPTTAKKTQKTKTRTTRGRKQKGISDIDEEEGSDDNLGASIRRPAARETRTNRKRLASQDQDKEFEPRSIRSTRSTRSNRPPPPPKLVFSDSDEE